ncbi:hypothetical protein BaRGS_00018459 [Batillaria attramentaria]|uniref:GIPC GH2 domain-containing protein n=1 Tax=Batillaria attramentaria TaxID=370345 RepID=A0ABD0KSQ3_9CAEN
MDVLLSVLVTTFLLWTPSLGARTSCDAPPVNVGEEASITCHFGEDLTKISSNKVSFKVKRSDHNDTVYSRDVVLDCDYWYGTSSNCLTVHPGYEYDKKVSDQLTVTIPIVTLQQAGKYICQVVGSDTSDIQACVLIVHNVTYTVNDTIQEDEEKKGLFAVLHSKNLLESILMPEDVRDRAIQEIDRLVNLDFHGGSDGTLAREVWNIGRSKNNSYDLWQDLQTHGMGELVDERRVSDIWGVITDAKRKPVQKDPKFR